MATSEVDAIMADFGRRVLRCRKSLNWSRKTLAAETGLTTKTIENIENGVREGTVRTAVILAIAMGVSVDHFVPLGRGGERAR